MKKSQRSLKAWGEQDWQTKSGKKVFRDWGKISTKESNPSSFSRRVRTNHSREKKSKEERETIFFTTKSNSKKDSSL